MGKRLVIKGADFSVNALDTGGSVTWVNNAYTWGKGGISQPGQSSGSTNPVMSMIGTPLTYAQQSIEFRCANGYEIFATALSDVPNPQRVGSGYNWTYTQDLTLQSYTVPAGKYFEISLRRMSGENADITVAQSSLLIKQTT